MRQKNHSIVIWVVVIFIITLACACPGIPQEIFAAQQGVQTVQSVLTEMPVEEIAQTAEAMATEMPVEDILGTMEVMASEMPISPEDMAATAAAGGLPVPLPGMGENNPPPDIPIVDEHNDDLFANDTTVSYTTSLKLNTVIDFYQTEMVKNDWQLVEGEPIITPQTAVLSYEKPQRNATVTIYEANDMTFVTIAIESK
jgi:hypothetical protein